jgi:hypothetical protein
MERELVARTLKVLFGAAIASAQKLESARHLVREEATLDAGR